MHVKLILFRNQRSAEEGKPGKVAFFSSRSVGSKSRERERIEELLEEKLKHLELEEKEKKQIRRNSIHINILHSQLPVEIVQRKKKDKLDEIRQMKQLLEQISALLQVEPWLEHAPEQSCSTGGLLSTAGDLHSTRVRHRSQLQRVVEVDMIDKALPK
jgi:predicted phage tail protein